MKLSKLIERLINEVTTGEDPDVKFHNTDRLGMDLLSIYPDLDGDKTILNIDIGYEGE